MTSLPRPATGGLSTSGSTSSAVTMCREGTWKKRPPVARSGAIYPGPQGNTDDSQLQPTSSPAIRGSRSHVSPIANCSKTTSCWRDKPKNCARAWLTKSRSLLTECVHCTNCGASEGDALCPRDPIRLTRRQGEAPWPGPAASPAGSLSSLRRPPFVLGGGSAWRTRSVPLLPVGL